MSPTVVPLSAATCAPVTTTGSAWRSANADGAGSGELVQAVQLAPLGKAARRIQVGFPGVVVVDLSGEEFEHAPRRLRRRREQRGGKHSRGRGEDYVRPENHGFTGFHR